MMSASDAVDAREWRSLAMPKKELCLAFTLPTGQSFRWRKTGDDVYTGVVHKRVVQMRQQEDDVEYKVLARGDDALPCDDAAVLRDYFNAGTSLGQLAQLWAKSDPRFRNVHPYFPGARVLRQDPVECLFQFVCSSNNHISRIHGMVERLCRAYGTPLPVVDKASAVDLPEDLAFYAFPTLEQLQEATDDGLRAEGFGYRAKFIVGSVAMLMGKQEGGATWLQGLREVPYLEASEALCSLPGVGPKVAACVCLFSLDKHAAIPVDTHVWQLAARYYTPHLKGKTLTKQLMTAVESALQDRFGSHAGWAHNTLFISELASQRHVLPAHLQPGARGKAAKRGSAPVQDAGAEAELSEPATPPQLLGQGQRGTARRASAKRSAGVKPDSKREAEEADAPHLSSHDQPYSCAVAADSPKTEPSTEKSDIGEGDEGSKAALDILEEGLTVKAEGSEPSARVIELVEVAAMDAFSELRPADLSPKTPLAEGEGTGEQQVAPKGKRRNRKAQRRD